METPKRIFKGLHLDNNPIDQPESTYRFALNTVNESSEGDLGFLANEKSNSECGQLPEGFIPIGYVTIKDNRTVVFSTNNTTSRIGIHDANNCTYEDTVVADCLSFNTKNKIEATYRSRNGCEDVVYFTDGVNPVRFFNFNRQDNFKDDSNDWNCDLFNLFLPNNVPCFETVEVKTTGELLSGTHNFAIQYLDQDLNPTHWIYSSQIVPIFASTESRYNEIKGSSNYETDSLGGQSFPTNKSIELGITNLSSSYSYYRLARIEATSFNGLPNRAYQSPPIPTSKTTVVVDGRNDGWEQIPVEQIVVKPERVNSAQHIEQVENRLLLGNTKGKPVNFCEFQNYASSIGTKYTAKAFDLSNVESDGNSKNENTYWGNMSFMADEVYALGIVYVFKDGEESPAFHIPGRPKDYDSQGVPNTGAKLDSDKLTTWNEEIEHLVPAEDENDYNNTSSMHLERWRYENTASTFPGNIEDSSADLTGKMAYWETVNSTYPELLDCNSLDYWGTDYNNNPLANQPIRHHKFPSRDIIPHIVQGASIVDTNDSTVTSAVESMLKFRLENQNILDNPSTSVTYYIVYELDNVTTASTAVFLPGQIDINNPNTYGPYKANLIETITFPDGTNTTTKTITNPRIVGGDAEYFDPSDPLYTWDYNFVIEPQTENVVESVSTKDIEGAGVLLGVMFYNIEYPHPDIIGHYFVSAERTDNNKTVLSKGVLGKCRQSQPLRSPYEYITFSYFFNSDPLGSDYDSNLHHWMMYPEYQYLNQAIKPTHIRHIGKIDNKNGVFFYRRYDGKGNFLTDEDVEISSVLYPYKAKLEGVTSRNYKFDKGVILNGSSYDDNYEDGNVRLYNLSLNNKIAIAKLTRSLPRDDRKLNYVSLKRDVDVYTDLFNLTYLRMHNCMHDINDYGDNNFGINESTHVYGGDTFITKSSYANALYRDIFKSNLYMNTAIAVGILAAAAVTVLTAGAAAGGIASALTFLGATGVTAASVTGTITLAAAVAAGIGVTSLAVTTLVNAYKDNALDQMAEHQALDDLVENRSDDYVAYGSEILRDVVIESDLNLGLRQDHTAYGEGHIFTNNLDVDVYFRDKIMTFDTENKKWIAKTMPLPEVYHYNRDYSRRNRESVYFPIPQTYNCCSDCLEEFPNRVWWSKQSFQEENTDNYRVFLSNDYLDMESELGNLQALVRKDTSIYAFTTKGVWKLLQNIQERSSGDLVTFVGTGEYLSLPPRSILDTDVDNVGTKSKWAILKLPMGIAFVNDEGSNIYIISESQGLNEISRIGMKNWFEDNLPFRLDEKDYPYRNSLSHEYGVGLISTYDAYNKRYILTKKDYKPLEGISFNGTDWVNGDTKVSFSDSSSFVNYSWTMSFSLLSNTWISWHSYMPDFYFPSLNSFISSNGNKLWKHNKPNSYQNYYGVNKPHIIEVVFLTSPLQTNIWDAVKFHTQAQKYNPTYNEVNEERYVTFKNAILYNHRQCSGKLDLISKDEQANPENYLGQQVVNESGKVLLNKDEGNWTFNDFRDYRTDYTTPVWDKTQSNLNPYYIDKVLNSNSIDFNKNWYELESMSSKYLVLRLEFSTFSDVELITKYIISESTPSFR